ncbi:MAG: APC family permease [Chloroflexi bacterium]|nr:MAG: APC family permease [Chloroflexota bacterium]
MGASVGQVGPGEVMVAQTELRAGGMGLWSVIAQAVTHIAPAMGFLTGATFIAANAGTGVSLAYFAAFLVCMAIGLTIIPLARYLPSAGGYFTYVSRTLHPRLGFLTAWLYFLYDPTAVAINFTILGFIFQHQLEQRLHINLPWPVVVAVGIIFVTFFVYRGVQISGRTMLILGGLEITILLAFALSGIISPGPGGINTVPFQVDPKFSTAGLFLGVVFAIFAFTGFEAVAPMAEESTNPRRNLPIAIVVSLVFMGAFYVFTTFGLAVGWGTNTFDSGFAGKDVGAFLDLAQRLWGGGWILLLFAMLNSAFAVGIAATNACTRVFFSMGRGGALPGWLGVVHPKYKTPRNAVILQTVITAVIAYVGGFWLGPDQLFFWFGTLITFGLIGVYGLGAIGVIRFYLTEKRAEFNAFWHLVIPVICVIAILLVGYESLAPGLSGIFAYVPWVLAGWIVLGVVILGIARAQGREGWLLKAGEVAYERQASPQEVAGVL